MMDMGFKLISSIFILFFMFTAMSCSGPQTILNTQDEVVSGVIKKNEVNKSVEVVQDFSDDRGIFDDEKNQLKTDLNQWRIIEDKDGIRSYEKIKSDSGLVAFRGEILIPAPLKKIANVLQNESLQKDWVDSFQETKLVSRRNDFEHIQYNQTKVPWPFENRDFVFQVNAKLNAQPPTMLINMKSVVDSAVPEVKGVVRGEIVRSYYYLKEMKGFVATKMVVEMEVNPKGAIPMWLVNLSQKSWPHNTLAAVKKLALREDIQILPKIDKYFDVLKVKNGRKKRNE